jgi:hypothetical protein
VILVDTSVWVDHFRAGEKALAGWLDAGMVLTHPFVIGELALGNLRGREIVLNALSDCHAPASPPMPKSCISSVAMACSGVELAMSMPICSPGRD